MLAAVDTAHDDRDVPLAPDEYVPEVSMTGEPPPLDVNSSSVHEDLASAVTVYAAVKAGAASPPADAMIQTETSAKPAPPDEAPLVGSRTCVHPVVPDACATANVELVSDAQVTMATSRSPAVRGWVADHALVIVSVALEAYSV
jgi:hypothetical protein